MTYPVSRYLGIDTTEGPSLAVDGDLLFRSDTTGTPQVWAVDAPGAWPRRLTAHDERVSVVAASPTRPEFVYAMDTGSDERDQLYRYDLEDGTERALTADPESIHLWGGWSPDGDRVAYAANRRAGDAFDVHVQRRDETADEGDRVFEGTGGFLSVEAWAPSGDALLVSKARSSSDQALSLVDLGTGERRALTDGEPARYAHAQFGPDGAPYVVTNRDADTAYVARLDPDTGDHAVVEAAGDWNVDLFALHRETGRVAYTRNVDGYSELFAGALDLADGDATLEVDRVPVEGADRGGVVSDLSFGPDGDRVAFARSADDRPHSVYVCDVGAVADGDGGTDEGDGTANRGPGTVERWTVPGTPGIPRESFRASETVRYESFDGREIPAYWTLPADAPPGETPVIVDIHGGPEHQRRPWFYPTKQYFLDRGYAVLEPNVRGSSGYGKAYTHLDDVEKRMDSVKDVRAAVAWLRDRPAVDPERVVAYGRSYGGFMVLAAITEYPDLWAAAVDFVGIADFVTFLENTGEWRCSHREAEYGSLAEDRDVLDSVSPIHQVDRIRCPLFIQHGANDPRVPVSETEQIAAAVREQGVPVETLVFEDEGHHTTSRANLVEEFERVAAFLDEHVGTDAKSD